MNKNKLTYVDSSYCKSYMLSSTQVNGGFDLFITYHNGAVYWGVVSANEVALWEDTYVKTNSIGKAFWAMLSQGTLRHVGG